MPQEPAYSPQEVKAAGIALLSRGVDPDPKTLWHELGSRGLPQTAWATWSARDQNAFDELVSVGVLSPESPEAEYTGMIVAAPEVDRSGRNNKPYGSTWTAVPSAEEEQK